MMMNVFQGTILLFLLVIPSTFHFVNGMDPPGFVNVAATDDNGNPVSDGSSSDGTSRDPFELMRQPLRSAGVLTRAGQRLSGRGATVRQRASQEEARAFAELTTLLQIVDELPVNVLVMEKWKPNKADISMEGDLLCFTSIKPTKIMHVSLYFVMDGFLVGLFHGMFDNTISSSSFTVTISTILYDGPERVYGPQYNPDEVWAPIYVAKNFVNHPQMTMRFEFDEMKMQKVCLNLATVLVLSMNYRLFSGHTRTVYFEALQSDPFSLDTSALIQMLPFVYYQNNLKAVAEGTAVDVVCDPFPCEEELEIVFSPLGVAIDHVKGNILKASFRIRVHPMCTAQAFLVLSKSANIHDRSNLLAGTFQNQRHNGRTSPTYLNMNLPSVKTGNELASLIIAIKCVHKDEENVKWIEDKSVSMVKSIKMKAIKRRGPVFRRRGIKQGKFGANGKGRGGKGRGGRGVGGRAVQNRVSQP